MLPRHVRHEGLRQIEHHLTHHRHQKPHSETATHTLGREHTIPDANIPKVVSFPAT